MPINLSRLRSQDSRAPPHNCRHRGGNGIFFISYRYYRRPKKFPLPSLQKAPSRLPTTNNPRILNINSHQTTPSASIIHRALHTQFDSHNGSLQNPDSQEQACRPQGRLLLLLIQRRRQCWRKTLRHRWHHETIKKAQGPRRIPTSQGEEPRRDAEEAQEEDLYRSGARHPSLEYGDARRSDQAKGQKEG